MKWHFITAGVGSSDFESAADRLAKKIQEFGLFETVTVYKTSDVFRLAPEILEWYSLKELNDLKGFGWYVWKSRFAKIRIDEIGAEDGVMYLDAGCEAFISSFSKKKLLEFMSVAETSGICLFDIPTPEMFYSKQLILERFQIPTHGLEESQFQSGSWLISSTQAKKFIHDWDKVVWEDKRFTDESPSPAGEVEGFICNRYDQAVFSVLARTYKFQSCGQVPPGDLTKLKSKIKFFSYPFAWARNRSGNSVVPRWLIALGKFSLAISRFRKSTNKLK